jgi:hypothetical protein
VPTAEPVSGVVLVHGGDGTAYRDWVRLWNERGYAAISIAHEGQADRKHPEPEWKNGHWIRHDWEGPRIAEIDVASSSSRRLSSSTGSRNSSHSRGSTGIAITGCLRPITRGGRPSPLWLPRAVRATRRPSRSTGQVRYCPDMLDDAVRASWLQAMGLLGRR